MTAPGGSRRGCPACPSTASARSTAGADLAAAARAAPSTLRRRRRPAWSPARWSARPRAGSAPASARRRWPTRPTGVVACRGPHRRSSRTHHGLVMAAAGIDASNTEPGTVVLLPLDPDASARRLREALPAHRPQRRGPGHRHRRPGLAHRADRHRHRRRRPRRAPGLRRPHRPARQRARGHRPGGGRRARRRRRPGQAQARPPAGRRRPRPRPAWCCRPAGTAPAPSPWCAPRRRTCSGSAPARRCSARCTPTTRAASARPARPLELVVPALRASPGAAPGAARGRRPSSARLGGHRPGAGGRRGPLRAAAFALGWRRPPTDRRAGRAPLLRFHRRTP